MRTSPYPVPPSRMFRAALVAVYACLTLAGGLTLALLPLYPQSPGGVVVLSLWGGFTLVSALACLWGVLRARRRPLAYRWEWFGCYGIAAGTAAYVAATLAQMTSIGMLLASLPTVLIFLALVGSLLTRAIWLALIDMRARKQVQAERALTDEIPAVTDE